MNKLAFTLATISILASTTTFAKDSYYIKGLIGSGYVPKQKVLKIVNNTSVHTKGYGVLGMLGLGYNLDHYSVRTDIEFYTDGGLKGKKNVYENKLNTNAGFWNFAYDFKNQSKFTPFIHAGIGYAFNKEKFTDAANSFEKKKNGFAYKLGLGTSYNITNKLDFEASYFYLNKGAKNHTFNMKGQPAYRYKGISGQTHALAVGLRFGY